MEKIPLVMTHENLGSVPEYPLPEGYGTRLFRRGEGRLWAEIETEAGEFDTTDQGFAQFEKEFVPFIDDFVRRCLLLEDHDGAAVGTATAWYSSVPDPHNADFQDASWGRLHWVGICGSQQGQGLGKPLVSATLRLLTELGHKRAYLTTQTTSMRAIKMYLDFGFAPHVKSALGVLGWKMVAEELGRPGLLK